MGFIDRVKKNNTWEKDLIVLLGLAFIILLLNYILANYFVRWDLTEDKRYSLSPKTVEYLKDEENIPDKIIFRIYLHGELPSEFKKLETAIQEKLDEIRVYAEDKIEYEFINPNEGSKTEVDELHRQLYDKSMGITPTDFYVYSSGENKHMLIWPGAEIIYNGQITGHVQFFQQKRLNTKMDLNPLVNTTINNLEYAFVSAIRRTVTEKKKKIGFLQGHDELDQHRTGRLRELLAPYYKIKDVELSMETDLLNLDGLIVAQPKKAFSTKDKFLIDQFVMKGGTVMWFLDQINVNEDSLFLKGETFGIPYNLNLDDQLFKYGVRVNKDLIASSKQKAAPIYVPNHPQGILPWLFYPVLEGAGTNITKNVDPVRSEYVSSIDAVGGPEITKSVVLTAGDQTKILKSPVRVNFNYVTLEDFADPYEYNTAMLLEGQFTSFFKNHPVVQILKDSMNYEFVEACAKPGKMLVVSDGDLLKNDFDSMQMKSTGRTEYRYFSLNFNKFDVQANQGKPKLVFGNEEFLQNIIDYVMEDETLIDIRSKSITLRLLDKDKIAKDQNLWKLINIATPLLLILILALIMILVRKRKYAS